MRAKITGRVVYSEKKKPESKMFSTQVLQTGGSRAELVTVYTQEKHKEGETTLECNIQLSTWKDRSGNEKSSIMVIQVPDIPMANVNPIKRSI